MSTKIETNTEHFYRELKQKVFTYLKENNYELNPTKTMMIKTVIIFAMWIASFAFTIYMGSINPWMLLLGVFPMYASLTLMQLGIMHDGSHKSVSKSNLINFLAARTMNLAGASSIIWYKKHCVAHHNHTNVLGHDEDTDTGDLIRLHPGSESFKYQKYQHLYSWPLYALHTIRWMLFDDILDYRSNKWNLNKKEMKSLLVEIIYSKAWHISIFMLVPYLVSGSLLITAIFYLLHFSLIGLSVATTFNLAHVTRVQDFYLDKDEKPKDWAVHQIKTTADFAGQSAILTWMVGGLNLQTIHHIFPNISHVHYRKIQKIVLEFCKERGVEYNNYPTVWSALKDHYKHLKELGNPV